MIFKVNKFKHSYDLSLDIQYNCGTDQKVNAKEHSIEGTKEEIEAAGFSVGDSLHGVPVVLFVPPKKEKATSSKKKVSEPKPKKKSAKK